MQLLQLMQNIATISLGAIHGEINSLGSEGTSIFDLALWKFKLDQVDEDNPCVGYILS